MNRDLASPAMSPDTGLEIDKGGVPDIAGKALQTRLGIPDAFLSRTDLRALGLPRRAVDSIFRALPVVVFEGYSRPLVTVRDYLELVERSTYRGDRVRP